MASWVQKKIPPKYNIRQCFQWTQVAANTHIHHKLKQQSRTETEKQ